MRKFILLLFPAAILLYSCNKNSSSVDSPEDPTKVIGDVTYIFYAQAGSGIQPGIEENISELASACSDQSTRAYIAFNQATGNTPPYYQALFYSGQKVSIIPDSLTGKNPQMSSTDYFTAILNDAKLQLPAKKYILVLSGHGNGYSLFGDGQYPITKTIPEGVQSMPGLALAQIKLGLQNSTIKPDELLMIYMDACLMSGMEYCAELSGLAQYMLANPTTTPGAGGNYLNLATLLTGSALTDNIAFENQVMQYMKDLVTQSGSMGWNNDYSQNSMISLTRLYNMGEVNQAMGNYMTEFVSYRNPLSPTDQATLDTKSLFKNI